MRFFFAKLLGNFLIVKFLLRISEFGDDQTTLHLLLRSDSFALGSREPLLS